MKTIASMQLCKNLHGHHYYRDALYRASIIIIACYTYSLKLCMCMCHTEVYCMSMHSSSNLYDKGVVAFSMLTVSYSCMT